MYPEVSVITPVFNRAKTIGIAIESVCKQTFTNWEMIIVDDGSTDNTEDIAHKYTRIDRRVRFFKLGKNYGRPAVPRNEGVRRAKGEYIAFLDSDDWWHPKKLEISIKHLRTADVVYHDLAIHTPKGKKILKKVKGRSLRKPVFVDLMRMGNALSNSAVVTRRSIIDAVGGLNEHKSLVAGEDFDLWLRISKVTDRFHYIPQSLGSYWIGNDNISTVSEKEIALIEAIYDRHIKFLSEEDRKQAEYSEFYQFAKIKWKMGLLRESVKYFGRSVKSDDVCIKVKSMCYMALAYVNSLVTGGV